MAVHRPCADATAGGGGRDPASALLVLSPPWRLHEAQVVTGTSDERPRSTRRDKASIAGLALLAIVGIAAAVALLRINSVTAAPPIASPTVAPAKTPTPTVAPSKAPSPTPPSVPASVDLDNASGHDVSILIHDQVGDLVDAESGTPGDGMSVRWHDSIVENVDATSIRVTWVGLPGDDVSDLGISGAAGAYLVTVVQPGPYPYTDAMGEDRVLILTFDAPVSADDVSVEILDRTVD